MSDPIQITIEKPQSFSRIQLLFGFLIAIPQIFKLLFKSILAGIYMWIAAIVILFTGKYPDSMWEYNKEVAIYQFKLMMYLQNIVQQKPE